LKDRDEIVSGLILFYLQHYYKEKERGKDRFVKEILPSVERYFSKTNYDVKKFLEGPSELLMIRKFI
jgi:hypothetical protein